MIEPFDSPYISSRPSGNTSTIFTPALTRNFSLSAFVIGPNFAPKNSDLNDSPVSPFTMEVLPSLFFRVTVNSLDWPSRLTVTRTVSPGRLLPTISINLAVDFVSIPSTLVMTSLIFTPASFAAEFSEKPPT